MKEQPLHFEYEKEIQVLRALNAELVLANTEVAALNAELLAALVRAEIKLRAYLGVCKDDKELRDTVLPMATTAIAKAEEVP